MYKKAKQRIIRIDILVIVIFVVAAIGFYIYNMPENRLARALDLGQKYLLEEDYEQAIVEFDKVIEIEPMNVDAYLGKAEAYIGMDDMEAAIAVLEEGYSLTGNEEIQKKLDEMRDSMTETERITEESEVVNTGGDSEEADKIEDNRWFNPKIEVDDETKNAIREVIDLGNVAQYEEACQLIGTDEFIKMVDKYNSEINGRLCGGTINTFLDEYIIYIVLMYGNPDGYSCDFVCIPESGNGFIVSRMYGTSVNGESYDHWGYLTCPVDEYQFNGLCQSCYYYNDNSVDTGEAKLKNSYYDGQRTVTHTWNDSGNSEIWVCLYDDGYAVPYGEDGEYVITEKIIHDDGGEGGARQKKEEFEKESRERVGPRSADIQSAFQYRYNDKMPWE